jgi:hypothetical protein
MSALFKKARGAIRPWHRACLENDHHGMKTAAPASKASSEDLNPSHMAAQQFDRAVRHLAVSRSRDPSLFAPERGLKHGENS